MNQDAKLQLFYRKKPVSRWNFGQIPGMSFIVAQKTQHRKYQGKPSAWQIFSMLPNAIKTNNILHHSVMSENARFTPGLSDRTR
jgi:hypothetical protein